MGIASLFLRIKNKCHFKVSAGKILLSFHKREMGKGQKCGQFRLDNIKEKGQNEKRITTGSIQWKMSNQIIKQ